jgi:flavin-dependent dehydrogenase
VPGVAGDKTELPRLFFLWVKDGLRPWLKERVATGLESINHRKVGLTLVFSGSLVLLIQLFFYNRERRRLIVPLKPLHEWDPESASMVDVAIVGAGPAGSTCAFYLASAGVRVLVLEKDAFPRDKVCGDVLCAPAQDVLKDMGAWQRIAERNCFRWLGVSALVGRDAEHSVVGAVRSRRNVAVQRIVLDEELAAAARGAGAAIEERHNVVSVYFDATAKRWHLECENGSSFESTFLIAADGAASHIARQVGVVTEPPNAWGTRRFVRPEDVAAFQADLAIHYARHGPVCLVREVQDFVLVSSVHTRADEEEMEGAEGEEAALGVVRRVVGAGAATTAPQTCAMRVGGVARCAETQFLVLGDAAGQCDPLSGHGIYPAFVAAKAAARTIVDSLSVAGYQGRLRQELRGEFWLSSSAASVVQRYPAIVEAAIRVCKRHGSLYLSDIIAGFMCDKSSFLYPKVSLLIAWESVKGIFRLE